VCATPPTTSGARSRSAGRRSGVGLGARSGPRRPRDLGGPASGGAGFWPRLSSAHPSARKRTRPVADRVAQAPGRGSLRDPTRSDEPGSPCVRSLWGTAGAPPRRQGTPRRPAKGGARSQQQHTEAAMTETATTDRAALIVPNRRDRGRWARLYGSCPVAPRRAPAGWSCCAVDGGAGPVIQPRLDTEASRQAVRRVEGRRGAVPALHRVAGAGRTRRRNPRQRAHG
jgi:hypothetical protein